MTDGPWSSPAEHRAATTLAAVDAFHAALNREQTVEADPWEQLDQLREQLGSARAWAVALEQRVEAVRSWFYSANQYTSLLDVLDAPLEVERP